MNAPLDDFLAKARAGRNRAWTWWICTPLALAIWILLSVATAAALMASGLSPPNLKDEFVHVRHPVIYFLATLLIFGLLLVGYGLAIALIHRRSPGSCLGRWSWRDLAKGFLAWFAVSLAATGLDVLVGGQTLHVSAGPGFLALLLSATPALAVQTFTEEFIFRGYATQGLVLGLRRPLAAALLSGVLFALLHIPNGGPQAFGALAFGVATALAAMRTGGLGFGYGIHLANNLFAALVVVSSEDVFQGTPGLFTAVGRSNGVLDVGVEAGALAIVVALLTRRPRRFG